MAVKTGAPAKTAELVIQKPSRLIIGLQNYSEIRQNQFAFTACRYFESDRIELQSFAWNDVEAECELRTSHKTYTFTGRFRDARMVQTDDQRMHPWAELTDVKLLDERDEENSFDEYNRLTRQAETEA